MNYFSALLLLSFLMSATCSGEEQTEHDIQDIKVQVDKDYSVLQLTRTGLTNEIKRSKSLFIKFYAPWCGHCKAMAPEWEKLGAMFAASELTKIVQVDCDKHRDLCREYGVAGFPTLKLYKQNEAPEGGIRYEGARTIAGFSAFLQEEAKIPFYFEDNLPVTLPPLLSKEGILAISFAFGALVGIFFFCLQPSRKITPPKFYSVLSSDEPMRKEDGRVHESIVKDEDVVPSADTLYDNFQLSVKNCPKNRCFGVRKINEDGEAGEYVWSTYEEVNERIHNLAAGLMHYRMVPAVDGMRMMAIYMKNCPEWEISAQALFSCNGVTVPLYDTLGADSTEFIMNQTQLSTVVCTPAELKKLIQIKERCPALRNIILVGELDDDTEREASRHKLKVRTIESIEEVGKQNPREPTPHKPDAIATFMYTSGTTGTPKGVLLTSTNILMNAAGVLAGAADVGIDLVNSKTRYLSYLPLAHVFERVVFPGILGRGGAIGFYQGSPLKLLDDLTTLRPTVFTSVPRLLNKIYDKVIQGANSGSAVKSYLFNTALNTKIANLKFGYTDHPLWDALVFSKIRKKIGLDQCGGMISGAAPLSPDVMNFLRVALGFPVLEGYGQTESAAGSALNHPFDLSAGTVGCPVPGVKIKLVSVPEMNYLVTDTAHGDLPCDGRGEICFSGSTIFAGYYKRPEETAKAIDENGWLHSGDIGLWTLDGKLKIIDRKKNIFKLSQGEYVAVERVETVVATSSFVSQAFVYGDSFHAHLVGIIVPDDVTFKQLARENGIDETDMSILCRNEKLIAKVQEDMNRVSAENKLNGFEKVRDIYLHPEPFSVEANLLTPTFKIRRNEAKAYFMEQIDQLYEKTKIAGKTIKQH